MIQDELVRVVREFTATIINPYDLDELLHRLTGHATEVVSAAGVGIMLAAEDGELEFVAASEDRVVEAEQRQAHLKSGACYEAFSRNEIVVVNSMAEEERWPDYRQHIVELGLHAVLGVPMNAFGQTIGVINYYREEPTIWTAEDVARAEIITSMGAGYVLNANQLRAQHTLSDQLRDAIDSRDVIGQAKGIIMATLNVDSDTAFETLRKRSQDSNRKLRDLAGEIVDSHGEQSTRATRGS